MSSEGTIGCGGCETCELCARAVTLFTAPAWAVSKPLTREFLLKAYELSRQQEEHERENPRREYVSPRVFEEWVAAGIVDKDGNYI